MDWATKAAAEIVGKRLRVDSQIEDTIRKHYGRKVYQLYQLLNEAQACIDGLIKTLKERIDE